jgi:hypothetical protein
MGFISFLEAIGKDFAKGLAFAVKLAIPVASLAELLFPGMAPTVTTGVDVATLIQNAVLIVEQKFTAAGMQSATGAQKLAEVLLLTQEAVTSLLTEGGVTADAAYVTSLVNAVVAILNVQAAPSAASAAAAS